MGEYSRAQTPSSAREKGSGEYWRVCRWSRILQLVILAEQTCILIGQNGSVGDSIIAQLAQICAMIGASKFLW